LAFEAGGLWGESVGRNVFVQKRVVVNRLAHVNQNFEQFGFGVGKVVCDAVFSYGKTFCAFVELPKELRQNAPLKVKAIFLIDVARLSFHLFNKAPFVFRLYAAHVAAAVVEKELNHALKRNGVIKASVKIQERRILLLPFDFVWNPNCCNKRRKGNDIGYEKAYHLFYQF